MLSLESLKQKEEPICISTSSLSVVVVVVL